MTPLQATPDRGMWLAYASGVGERISQAMMTLLIPLWALQLHAPIWVIGLDVAAAALAPAAFAIPIGAAADRLGPRRIVAAGAAVAVLATLACAVHPNYWLLGLWQAIAGLGRSATWIGAQAIITKRPGGSRRAGQVGWLSLSAQIGNLAGPAIAGVLSVRIGMPIAFVVAALAMALVLVVAFSIRPTVARSSPSPRRTGNPRGGNFGDAYALMKGTSMRLVVVATMVRLGLIALRTSFYVIFLHNLGINTIIIGILFTVSSAASAVMAASAGILHRRFSHRALLLYGIGSMLAGMLAAPLIPVLWFQALAMTVLGIGNGISQPSLISLLAESTPPSQHGLALGLRTTLNRVSQFSAPLLLGIAATWVALPILLVGFSAAGLVALGITAAQSHAPLPGSSSLNA